MASDEKEYVEGRTGMDFFRQYPLRQWRPFHEAGVNFINAPGSYFVSLILEQPVSVGGYRHSQTPDHPTVMTMLRGYEHPGLHIKDHSQHRLRGGR